MPALEFAQREDNQAVRLEIDLDSDHCAAYVDAFARFMLACSFDPRVIAENLRGWADEHDRNA